VTWSSLRNSTGWPCHRPQLFCSPWREHPKPDGSLTFDELAIDARNFRRVNQMFTKLAAAFGFALVIGPSGLACQPQWVDRAVLDDVDINRDDAGAAMDAGARDGRAPFDAMAAAKPDAAIDAAVASDARVTPPVVRPDTGSGGAGGAIDAGRVIDATGTGGAGGGRIDAAVDAVVSDPRADAGGDGRADGAPASDPLVAQLLAITPAACAMKAAGDFDLDAPGGASAGKAAICGIKGAFYWVADMNIDCDGRNPSGSKCGGDHGEETFVHNKDDKALSPTTTPFAVLPTSAASNSMPAIAVKPGAIVAVINNETGKIVFAVFGDMETDNRIGAASYACAEQLGIDPTPSTGGKRGNTVTYVAFTDSSAVPRDLESQTEARQLGRTLAAKLIADNK
jgi:hypothetical protein